MPDATGEPHPAIEGVTPGNPARDADGDRAEAEAAEERQIDRR